MICDHLEARARSLDQSGKLDDVEDLVEIVLNELMNDEQLDNITLKLGHLRQIKDILKRELRAIYSLPHKRVDYDKAKPVTKTPSESIEESLDLE